MAKYVIVCSLDVAVQIMYERLPNIFFQISFKMIFNDINLFSI